MERKDEDLEEIDGTYRCGMFRDRVMGLDAWLQTHTSHGKATFENFHDRYRWRVCPCGAKILEPR